MSSRRNNSDWEELVYDALLKGPSCLPNQFLIDSLEEYKRHIDPEFEFDEFTELMDTNGIGKPLPILNITTAAMLLEESITPLFENYDIIDDHMQDFIDEVWTSLWRRLLEANKLREKPEISRSRIKSV